MRILCAESVLGGESYFSRLGDLTVLPDEQITTKSLSQCDIFVTRSGIKVNHELLAESPVKIIATATSGIDHVDSDAINQKNIQFFSAKGSNAISVAEYVIAALLSLAEQKQTALKAKTIGIVGYGEVGKRVATYAKLLGLRVLVNDPPLKAQAPQLLASVNDVSLQELLQQSDIVSLHPRLERQGEYPSYHLADEQFFREIKQGAWFLNTSRGSVVNTQALLNAIHQGRLGATVIDVWEHEPYYSLPLFHAVDIATPHIAGYSYTARLRGTYQVYDQICQAVKGKSAISWSEATASSIQNITLDNRGLELQQAVYQAFIQVYKILEDEQRFQETSRGDNEQRAMNFTRLRRKYHIRWECHHYQVKLCQADKHLTQVLQEFGFIME